MTFAKYIILKKHGLETAVLLHPSISHNEVVDTDQLALQGTDLVSAGYCTFGDGAAEVVRGMPSTTLSLHPRPQDAEIIDRTLFLIGLKLSPPDSQFEVQSSRFKVQSSSTVHARD